MRAVPPNRQTGVAPHVFSCFEELAEARSPPKSTRGAASPLEFGQDLVKVPAEAFRTGDGCLGKANRARRHLSPNLTNRHQPSGFIRAALGRSRRTLTNDPQPCTTVVFHRCSKTARGRSTSPKQRCSWAGRRTSPLGVRTWRDRASARPSERLLHPLLSRRGRRPACKEPTTRIGVTRQRSAQEHLGGVRETRAEPKRVGRSPEGQQLR